eukprot:1162051-Pelagomonas_calceolata.AAC.15
MSCAVDPLCPVQGIAPLLTFGGTKCNVVVSSGPLMLPCLAFVEMLTNSHVACKGILYDDRACAITALHPVIVKALPKVLAKQSTAACTAELLRDLTTQQRSFGVAGDVA